jgi:cell wall-associated NlpC family hydrolase
MDRYIGIPYVVGGRDIHGLDCYGLVWLAEREIWGKELPCLVYGQDEDAPQLFIENRPLLNAEEVLSPVDGDMVLLFVHAVPKHIGVYCNNGVLHATHKNGVVWEKLDSPFMRRFDKKEFYRV